MKTTNFLRVALVALFAGSAFGVYAQGEKNHHGHADNFGRHNDGHRGDKHNHHGTGHQHRDVHVYHHDHNHAPVERRVVYHHPAPVRYVYYSDYDVYYDCQRSVYISFSGRNWSVSTRVPVAMHRVDIQHAVRVDVDDYYDDDFTQHLERRRPGGRVYAVR
jgi:hypothetical protein